MVLGFMQLRAISIMIKCHRRRFKWQDAWVGFRTISLNFSLTVVLVIQKSIKNHKDYSFRQFLIISVYIFVKEISHPSFYYSRLNCLSIKKIWMYV